MPTQILQATMAELETIIPLFDAYRVFYQQASDLTVARTFLTERLRHQDSVIFLAVDRNSNGIGFVQLYPSFSSVSAKHLWILNDLFVAESARRQGIAKHLMNRAREFAVETNAKGLFLETAHDNFNGQSLYESLGYQKNSEFYYFLDLQNPAPVDAHRF
jgi:ribosomal protein S18 acetylase RimI-like enzyme